MPERRPTHGFTRHGLAVHAKVIDHHPANTRYQRFNKWLAVQITARVGTMTCFWAFNVLAFFGLPAALYQANVIGKLGFITAAGFLIMVQWAAQSYSQLVLLPSIMVGQNLQNEAADARSAKTFEDVEKVLDALDTKTSGGITEVLEAVLALSRGGSVGADPGTTGDKPTTP